MPPNHPGIAAAPRRRRHLRLVLVAVLLGVIALVLYYRIDEAPSPDALRWQAMPLREVADTDNAWLYLIGMGAAQTDDPITAGRARVATYLAPPVGMPMPADAQVEALPPVDPARERDGFAAVCRAALGGCIRWAAQHRTALRRLVEANAVRLARLDRAAALPQWQEPPLRNLDFPMIAPTTIRLHAAGLALRAADGEDPVGIGRELARHAALWRRAGTQTHWLVDKLLAVVFLADYRRLLVEVYAQATPTQRAALDGDIDATLAIPGAEENALDLLAYDILESTLAIARRELPGIAAAIRQCMRPAPAAAATDPDAERPRSCTATLLANATFLPQATTNRVARHASAYAHFMAAMPADETAAEQYYEAQRPFLLPAPVERWLPERNAGGLWFLREAQQRWPERNYRRRLNDHELLRRLLVIRVAALRAGIADSGMAAFLAQQPTTLQHPYPDKAIAWDAVRSMLVAPTAVDGIFDEAGLELRIHDAAATPGVDPPPQPRR